MPVSIASTARRRVDLEGVLVASSMSTSLVIVGRRQRRRRSGGAALLSSSSTRPSRSPGLALPDVHSRCMCCDCTGLEPICAAADQRPARSGFLRIRLDPDFCGSRTDRFGFYVSLAATLNDKFDRARLQPLSSRLSLLRRMFSIEL